ncbi:MAG: polysaccharide biosynthesis protein [Halanaerobiales bacterium]|nr:polysaccharide biosynthesis protein [Halanaerobiales bacterium]
MTDKSSSFLKGAFILSVAGILSKIMGFSYRIILSRILGDEGIGLYQMAYPIYTTLLVVSRSGIPIALAKLISDRVAKDQRKAAFKIFTVGRKLSIIVGLFFSILMAVSAKPIVNLLNWDPRAFYAVLALSPAIFFVSIMATYRGFFQGLQNMVPTAYSQVLEQLVRMITMIGLVYYLIRYSLGYAAAGATFGAVTGSIAGLIILLIIYNKKKTEIFTFMKSGSVETIKTFKIVKDIAYLGIPITLGALVLPLMNLVDAVIVPNRLQVAGFSIEVASQLYGRLAGMAMVLVNFPTIISVALAASLVPAISEAFAQNKNKLIKKRTETALRLTILIGLPSAAGLYILAEPLTRVIFGNAMAAVPLRIVSWGVLFITIQQSTSGIIQGIGKTKIPARNLFIGAIVNAFLNYTLTALPAFGIKGASIGTVTGFAVAAILNLISLKFYTNYRIKVKQFIIKPIITVSLMVTFTHYGFNMINSYLSSINIMRAYTYATFLIVIFSIILYFILLIVLKEIKYTDLKMIPYIGEKTANFLRKYKIL